MNTTFRLVVSCDKSQARQAESVLYECHELIAHIENELTEFRDHSPVFKLNRAQPGEPVQVSLSFIEIFRISMDIQKQTDGRFNIYCKSVDQNAEVTIDENTRTATRKTNGTTVSFGAIGKGYAIDKVRIILEQNGFTNYLISAGGSSQYFSGYAADKIPWKWAWTWQGERQAGLTFEHKTGEPIALGVTGLEEQGNHIIDASTGRPTTSGNRSALVASASATRADAYSTAFFQMNFTEAMQSAEENSAVAVIESDESPKWNGTFQNLWGGITTLGLGCFVWLQLFLQDALASTEDEEFELDLSDVGDEIFNPYLYERNEWWMLLPAFTIVLIILHLTKGDKIR